MSLVDKLLTMRYGAVNIKVSNMQDTTSGLRRVRLLQIAGLMNGVACTTRRPLLARIDLA